MSPRFVCRVTDILEESDSRVVYLHRRCFKVEVEVEGFCVGLKALGTIWFFDPTRGLRFDPELPCPKAEPSPANAGKRRP
jgi:hypothetical protein